MNESPEQLELFEPEPTDAELQAEVASFAGCAGCGSKVDAPTVQKPSLELNPLLAVVLEASTLSAANKAKVYDAAAQLNLALKTQMVNGTWPVYLCGLHEEIHADSPLLGFL